MYMSYYMYTYNVYVHVIQTACAHVVKKESEGLVMPVGSEGEMLTALGKYTNTIRHVHVNHTHVQVHVVVKLQNTKHVVQTFTSTYTLQITCFNER